MACLLLIAGVFAGLITRLKEGESMTVGEIKDYCKGQIAYFKIPRYYKFVDEYPMTASGKVKKYVMREQAANEFKSYLT